MADRRDYGPAGCAEGCATRGAALVGVLLAVAALLPLGRRPRFDTPCDCGHMSSECTKREDGTCG